MPIEQLLRILSASIAPVIVISGVGMLLLSMTNRFGRVIDRSRALVREPEIGADNERGKMLRGQLAILHRRGKILRGAILYCSASVFCACIGIVCLFGSQILQAHYDYVCTPMFALALLLMIPGVFLFIRDITVSLEALELEIAGHY